MKTKEQRIITLTPTNGDYYNFFNTSLGDLMKDGWCVFQMSIDKEKQCGWVILERIVFNNTYIK